MDDGWMDAWHQTSKQVMVVNNPQGRTKECPLTCWLNTSVSHSTITQGWCLPFTTWDGCLDTGFEKLKEVIVWFVCRTLSHVCLDKFGQSTKKTSLEWNLILTSRERFGLDHVQKRSHQICHHVSTAIRRPQGHVLRLGDVLMRKSPTDRLWRDRPGLSQCQQHHSNDDQSQRCVTALWPPDPHVLTHVYRGNKRRPLATGKWVYGEKCTTQTEPKSIWGRDGGGGTEWVRPKQHCSSVSFVVLHWHLTVPTQVRGRTNVWLQGSVKRKDSFPLLTSN